MSLASTVGITTAQQIANYGRTHVETNIHTLPTGHADRKGHVSTAGKTEAARLSCCVSVMEYGIAMWRSHSWCCHDV